eukprot:scaffold11493_cov31-Tisochrysis_lutea.AAC.2
MLRKLRCAAQVDGAHPSHIAALPPCAAIWRANAANGDRARARMLSGTKSSPELREQAGLADLLASGECNFASSFPSKVKHALVDVRECSHQ